MQSLMINAHLVFAQWQFKDRENRENLLILWFCRFLDNFDAAPLGQILEFQLFNFTNAQFRPMKATNQLDKSRNSTAVKF